MLIGATCTLRAARRDDLVRLCAYNNDLAVELAGGGDPPMPQSLERLQADFDREAARGGRDDAWFVIDVDGQCVGHCGLMHIDATARTAELGIGIGDKTRWGQGIGSEAVGLLLTYAFRYRNLERVWLQVHARNERAIRAYARNGFVEEGRQRRHVWIDGDYHDNVLMGILRTEWIAART